MNRPWYSLLNLADIWKNDDIPFAPAAKNARLPGPPYNRRDLIVGRIKMLSRYVEDHEREDFDEDLWWIVDEMSDVQNEDDFDMIWDAFYDWADSHRVWVELWNPERTRLVSR